MNESPSPQKKRIPGLPILIIALALLPILASPFLRQVKDRKDGLIGKEAPELRFMDQDGKPVKLSQFRGNGVLLNFWASWCGPCMEEMADLKLLGETLAGKGLRVVALNIEEPLKAIQGALKGRSLPPLYFQPLESDLLPYGTSALPTTYFIDRKGKVLKKFTGSRDWASRRSQNEIQSWLSQEN